MKEAAEFVSMLVLAFALSYVFSTIAYRRGFRAGHMQTMRSIRTWMEQFYLPSGIGERFRVGFYTIRAAKVDELFGAPPVTGMGAYPEHEPLTEHDHG